MTWQNSAFNWPASAQAIQNSSESVLNQVAGKMTESSGLLNTLASNVTFNKHPLSNEAQALINLRSQLDSLLCSGQILSVHPYQFSVGHNVESGYHLAPDIAVSTLAAKLLDTNDRYRPTSNINVVGWMIAEKSLAEFAKATKALFGVVNIPELGMVSRRLEKEQSLQTDKFTRPSAIVQPRFKPQLNVNPQPLREALKWQGAQVAQLESLAADKQSPVEKLSHLAQKRGEKLDAWKQAINALKSSGVEIYKFEASGTPDVIATRLNQSAPPSRANSSTFASLFISASPLTFLSEVFT